MTTGTAYTHAHVCPHIHTYTLTRMDSPTYLRTHKTRSPAEASQAERLLLCACSVLASKAASFVLTYLQTTNTRNALTCCSISKAERRPLCACSVLASKPASFVLTYLRTHKTCPPAEASQRLSGCRSVPAVSWPAKLHPLCLAACSSTLLPAARSWILTRP